MWQEWWNEQRIISQERRGQTPEHRGGWHSADTRADWASGPQPPTCKVWGCSATHLVWDGLCGRHATTCELCGRFAHTFMNLCRSCQGTVCPDCHRNPKQRWADYCGPCLSRRGLSARN
jgi:hypothetical protein